MLGFVLFDFSYGPGHQTLADLLSWYLVLELSSIEALREVQGDELLLSTVAECSVSSLSFTGTRRMTGGTELLLVPHPNARPRCLPSALTFHVVRGTETRAVLTLICRDLCMAGVYNSCSSRVLMLGPGASRPS